MVGIMVASTWSELNDFNAKQPFVPTQGRVVSIDCGDHGAYRVAYGVGDQTLARGPGSRSLKADCADLRPNQEVPVWYSAQDPGFASFVDPLRVRYRIRSEIGAIIFVGYPLMALFLYLSLKFKTPAKRGHAP
jgi:hypothetical protein